MQKLNSLVKQDAGPTVTEYATTLSVVTLSCLAAFALVAAASTGTLVRIAGYLT